MDQCCHEDFEHMRVYVPGRRRELSNCTEEAALQLVHAGSDYAIQG